MSRRPQPDRPQPNRPQACRTRTNWTLANRILANWTSPPWLRLTVTEMAACARHQQRRLSPQCPARSPPCHRHQHYRQSLSRCRWPHASHRRIHQPPTGQPQVALLAGLLLGESVVPGCPPDCCCLRLTRMSLRHRLIRSDHQLTLCSLARSRAFGRSLPSGSRAQPASTGRSAPRGSCSYALAGALAAVLASPATRHVAITCPCSAPRLSGRGASALAGISGALAP